MNHHFFFKDPLSTTLDKVSYMCIEKYDGGSFLSYPHRKKKPWIMPDVNDPLYMSYQIFEKTHFIFKTKQKSFMQIWLFFDLFNEVLINLYREKDFLVKDSAATDRFILCIKKLRSLLKAACRSRFEKTFHDTSSRFDHLRVCLILIAKMSFAFRSNFDWRLMCSIAVVHEATVYSLNQIARNLEFAAIPDLQWTKKFFEVVISNRMLKTDWCSSDIERAKNKFSSTQSLYFFSRMRKNEIRRKHLTCTTSLCSFMQIDLATYQTKHRQTGCSCLNATLNINHVVTLLRSQKISFLNITQTDEDLESLQIEVVAHISDIRYVAISHVWADGLENPKKNSFSICQLSYILKRVNSLRACVAFLSDPVSRAQNTEDRPLLI